MFMTFQNHCYFLKRGVPCPFANTVDCHFNLSRTVHDSTKGISCSHAQIIVAMGRNYGFVYVVDMFNQIFNFSTIFTRQAVSCSVRDVYNRCPCLDNGFYNPCQELIVRTTGIFSIKLYVFYIFLCILYGSNTTFDYFVRSAVEFIFYVLVARTYSCMYALTLSITQSISCHVDILFDCTR
ncbi:unknown [Prevotella sp. CAG:1058]|nr:unknown [Prevotella sp. CAG:1058]